MKKETSLTDKISKSASTIILISLIILFLGAMAFGGYFFFTLTPVDSKNEENITFNIEKGWGLNKVADELEKNDLIRSALTFKLYLKINDNKAFLAGTYNLSKNMSVNDIIENLTTGKSILDDSISITFVEGKKFPYYAQKIADNFGYTYDEVIAKTSDEEFLNSLINEYWFIGNDILNKNIYYPLEGYIFPDTYSFKKDATIEEIIKKMLDAMDSKLSNYKEEIELSGIKIHSLLTMASMVELEAVTPDDRLVVAGVFYNRLEKNMAMGSDVTTYYAVKKEMTESLYQSEIDKCNAYNTRGTCAVSFPVGPICGVSYSSLTAAITPTDTNYLYFVADVNNKLYFSNTNDEQLNVIRELRKQNLWPE